MARYSGSGWHNQSIRHSKARKYGKAGGRYLVAVNMKKAKKVGKYFKANPIFEFPNKKARTGFIKDMKKEYGKDLRYITSEKNPKTKQSKNKRNE
jgi:hypothetical protein